MAFLQPRKQICLNESSLFFIFFAPVRVLPINPKVRRTGGMGRTAPMIQSSVFRLLFPKRPAPSAGRETALRRRPNAHCVHSWSRWLGFEQAHEEVGPC